MPDDQIPPREPGEKRGIVSEDDTPLVKELDEIDRFHHNVDEIVKKIPQVEPGKQ